MKVILVIWRCPSPCSSMQSRRLGREGHTSNECTVETSVTNDSLAELEKVFACQVHWYHETGWCSPYPECKDAPWVHVWLASCGRIAHHIKVHSMSEPPSTDGKVLCFSHVLFDINSTDVRPTFHICSKFKYPREAHLHFCSICCTRVLCSPWTIIRVINISKINDYC